MGFLHKLWDETLAGPAPEDGLGKLRKYNSFSAARSTAFPNITPPDHHGITTTPISRSITILRANSTNLRNVNAASSSESPSSPSGSMSPGSPLSRKSLSISLSLIFFNVVFITFGGWIINVFDRVCVL